MTYEEFKNQVLAKCKEFGEGAEFRLIESPAKGTGISKEIVNGASPVVWLKQFEGEDPEAVAKFVIEQSKACEEESHEVYGLAMSLLDKEPEGIVYATVRPKSKKDPDAVSREIFDLVVEYRIDVGDIASMLVTSSLAKNHNWTEERLWQASKQYTGFIYEDMMELLQGVLPEGVELEEYKMNPMYVASNRARCKGAGAMLCDEVLSSVAEELGCDLTIIPSSIHEVLLVQEVDAEYVKPMIHDVNAEQLAEDEVLGDGPYVYRRESHSLEKEGYESISLIA